VHQPQQRARLRVLRQPRESGCWPLTQCPPGKCVDGVCRLGCISGQIACNASCVNPMNDNRHCGTCYNWVRAPSTTPDASALSVRTASVGRVPARRDVRRARISAVTTASTT
jgi:hypothetical protein